VIRRGGHAAKLEMSRDLAEAGRSALLFLMGADELQDFLLSFGQGLHNCSFEQYIPFLRLSTRPAQTSPAETRWLFSPQALVFRQP